MKIEVTDKYPNYQNTALYFSDNWIIFIFTFFFPHFLANQER